ncbi:spore germination protein GerPB [Bacillus sp. S/N-304-OC-R1]|uniref:spore germination protein GerPB n=1 Tax=Bacillus sp. S/N-304-OC-R1 TaxID=2758034 RepID=UPI001C8D5493|nr:spore germination protein GerPB [Bacillus sp. S/N-304-OC-R1]MBY0121072.1 spore germination protein GerPB [Bacillus sp. S/N-304-OC-R1]
MNFYINQSININFIKIGGITNSSVLQIGSAGVIRPASYLYNTGGFTQPAPKAVQPGGEVIGGEGLLEAPSVPLHSAGR